MSLHSSHQTPARIGLPHARRVGASRGHLACLAAQSEDWPGKFQAIPWLYAEIVRLLAVREHVHILVNTKAASAGPRAILARAGVNLDQVSFHVWPTDRVWTRDSGPIFVRKADGQVAITDWRFNAWAKYPDWQLDDRSPAEWPRLLGLPEVATCIAREDGVVHRLVLEGGSIDVNGAGILLTTEECLLSEVQQRNPGSQPRAD